MKKLICSVFAAAFLFSNLFAQKIVINRIDPPNWWIGMKWNKLDVMLYGENLDSVKITSFDNRIKINNIYLQNNKYYSIFNITIPDNLPSGLYSFICMKGNDSVKFNYSLRNRINDKTAHQGFSDKDVIYLIFADRFADGDTLNDKLYNKYEKFDFGSLNGRHGGDIDGIINKLDYLENLGVTALWITPLLENNMYMSYHGYAATDLYKIDPRFGSNASYKKLVTKAHSHNLKIILDHVSNHIGINHPWVKRLPDSSWFNGSVKNHLKAHHDKLALIDIHGDSLVYEETQKGWFTDYMPDLNQTDPLLKNYLIQNTLWWIEFSGIDGIREDTYPYADQKYLSQWAKAILTEYPGFNIVGEIWKGDPPFLAKYQKDTYFPRKFNSNLPSVLDFAFSDILREFVSNKTGLQKIYELFAKDFVYKNPDNVVPFLDNHDIDRIMYVANNNLNKVKIALTILLTSRGIPQILYGTEIGMNGGGHHGLIRQSFPGGFPTDPVNTFTKPGRNELQEDIFNFTKTLLTLRKKYSALSSGKMIQFPPENNIYVYFKKNAVNNIMIAINNSPKPEEIELNDFADQFEGTGSLKNLFTNEIQNLSLNNKIYVNGNSASLFLLQPNKNTD